MGTTVLTSALLALAKLSVAHVEPLVALAGASTVGGRPLFFHGEFLSAFAPSGAQLIVVVAIILAIGVASQVLAQTFRVPAVLFLILSGIALGPEGLSLVTLERFGVESLRTIVGLSVAIIVFEGAFHLKIDRIKQAPSAALGLVTVGAIVSFVGTTLAVQLLLDPGWGFAAVVGALLVATGPTVITPILQVVPVRERVAAALETEGIVNDVTAAILAVVIFELVVHQETNPSNYLSEFVQTLSVGVVTGMLVAAVLWYLLVHVSPGGGWTPQNARLMTFAGALLAFSLADQLSAEAGVAAVATAGVLLGNADLPFEEQIEEFKGDITLIVLSFVFIALAALIEIGMLLRLGLAGLAVVLIVALVLRPVAVFASTGGDRFTRNERLFISFVGPRGIIPASVATLFALQLQSGDVPMAQEAAIRTADILAGTVFLVILLTVVFEGGLARRIAEKLDVIPMRVLVIGGGRVGTALADRLEERGENVVILEADEDKAEELRGAGYTARHADATDVDVLQQAGIGHAKIVVATTGDDDTNLLVAQLTRSKFDVERVIARVNQPGNVDAFEELEVETVSSTMATAHEIDNRIERPALSQWMTELGRTGDVQEIEVTDEAWVGRTIGELDDALPTGCFVALVGREGATEIPDDDIEIALGDHLTILGRTEAVREALELLHPRD